MDSLLINSVPGLSGEEGGYQPPLMLLLSGEGQRQLISRRKQELGELEEDITKLSDTNSESLINKWSPFTDDDVSIRGDSEEAVKPQSNLADRKRALENVMKAKQDDVRNAEVIAGEFEDLARETSARLKSKVRIFQDENPPKAEVVSLGVETREFGYGVVGGVSIQLICFIAIVALLTAMRAGSARAILEAKAALDVDVASLGNDIEYCEKRVMELSDSSGLHASTLEDLLELYESNPKVIETINEELREVSARGSAC